MAQVMKPEVGDTGLSQGKLPFLAPTVARERVALAFQLHRTRSRVPAVPLADIGKDSHRVATALARQDRRECWSQGQVVQFALGLFRFDAEPNDPFIPIDLRPTQLDDI